MITWAAVAVRVNGQMVVASERRNGLAIRCEMGIYQQLRRGRAARLVRFSE